HLNPTGCVIKPSNSKGRGVYASKPIPRNTTIEISPVLLFTKSEYEEHGKYTLLDHYTFVWPDGRMALALGLGSLFNHSDPPNVNFTLDIPNDSIRYIASRDIEAEEELCIFYGHKLWFDPAEGAVKEYPSRDSQGDSDEWGGLNSIDYDRMTRVIPANPFVGGDAEEILCEEDLPFVRYKVPAEEEELGTVRTTQAWVVDVPDPKCITTLLKWLKQNNLDTPDVAHLKRIRKVRDSTTFLISHHLTFPLGPPEFPEDLNLPLPHLLDVPASPALTPTQLRLKTDIWPTLFTPRRKDVPEKWCRGKVAWAWQAIEKTIQIAIEAGSKGELPIAAHVPTSYEELLLTRNSGTSDKKDLPKEFVAHDTRNSDKHPLHHAVMNIIRKMADSNTSKSAESNNNPAFPDTLEQSNGAGPTALQSGSNYLLTSLTLFTTHEPCVMCSMALLHSRVKEVIYLYPMPQTGACGSVTCLPTLKGVNHKYSIARWE
ncbi:hypothetical protein AGABI2DRAFT_49784, partial [Agaricus bisporus var. bisporus H97]|uniref:hypothetical protein n=1 Tax=Agaricus bisporus var. bisporus (strain H97 / ATCC MYA-4626 / FGSC 10389) TaxID=936046 RepID=UPI00029F4FF2